jgi:hypothetical protein
MHKPPLPHVGDGAGFGTKYHRTYSRSPVAIAGLVALACLAYHGSAGVDLLEISVYSFWNFGGRTSGDRVAAFAPRFCHSGVAPTDPLYADAESVCQVSGLQVLTVWIVLEIHTKFDLL